MQEIISVFVILLIMIILSLKLFIKCIKHDKIKDEKYINLY